MAKSVATTIAQGLWRGEPSLESGTGYVAESRAHTGVANSLWVSTQRIWGVCPPPFPRCCDSVALWLGGPDASTGQVCRSTDQS